MNSCSSGKRGYLSYELAEEALIQAWSNFYYSKGKGPVSIYQCEECGHFHFTSKGEMNRLLAELIKEGKVNRSREANDWERKLRGK